LNAKINAQQRKFIGEVRRCDELERRIRYVTAELNKEGHKVLDLMDDFPPAPQPREIIDLELHLEKTETEILELAANNVNLQTSYLELSEMIQVLERTDQFFSDQESHNFDLNKMGTHRDPDFAHRLVILLAVSSRLMRFGYLSDNDLLASCHLYLLYDLVHFHHWSSRLEGI